MIKSRLFKLLSEYFLGTETRRSYEEERNSYRKSITDPSLLNEFLSMSKKEEFH